jgi:hypothetical protein
LIYAVAVKAGAHFVLFLFVGWVVEVGGLGGWGMEEGSE